MVGNAISNKRKYNERNKKENINIKRRVDIFGPYYSVTALYIGRRRETFPREKGRRKANDESFLAGVRGKTLNNAYALYLHSLSPQKKTNERKNNAAAETERNNVLTIRAGGNWGLLSLTERVAGRELT